MVEQEKHILPDEKYTRRTFLIMRALNKGANWDAAVDTVTTTILQHPEWDLTERKTFVEWDRERA